MTTAPPTQQVKEQIAPFLVAVQVPEVLTEAVFQAIDGAGYTVVEKASGVAVSAVQSTPSERVQIAGIRGAFLVGVKIGERGWMVAIEQANDKGDVARSAWAFSSGGGDLLKRAKTTGRWTVGTSLVGGADKIT